MQVDPTSSDAGEQTKNVLAKIDALLSQAGTSKARIVMANVWLADITSFDAMNAAWEAWVDRAAPPARATVESTLAGSQYKVEISVIAAVPPAARSSQQ